MSTYAGTGSPPGSAGDNGPALDASVALPQGLAVNGAGNLYIQQINGDIRRVDAQTPTSSRRYRLLARARTMWMSPSTG